MTLQGYQFDKAKVTPEADAALNSYLAQGIDNKVINGLTATASRLNIYVATGKALVQGRLVAVTQQHQILAQANKSGFVCITVDLTQDNTATGAPGTSSYVSVNNQLRLELVETLVQQDLSNGGLIYTLPIYSYTATGTSITVSRVDSSYKATTKTASASLNYGISVNLTRIGNMVHANFPKQTKTVLAQGENEKILEKLPAGFRPSYRTEFGVNINSSATVYPQILYSFNEFGEVFVTNNYIGTGVFAGRTMYFTDDAMPE